jgi:hypothetical protein
MAYNVFIICAYKDLDIAADLTHRLEEVGITAFMSVKDIDVGLPVDAKTDRRALHNSDEVIVLLTHHALNSQQMTFEIGTAFGMHKPITPILIGVDVNELPPIVRELPSIRYGVINDYIAELGKRAKSKELMRS